MGPFGRTAPVSGNVRNVPVPPENTVTTCTFTVETGTPGSPSRSDPAHPSRHNAVSGDAAKAHTTAVGIAVVWCEMGGGNGTADWCGPWDAVPCACSGGAVHPAREQAGRHGRRRGCPTGQLGGDLGGREHRHRRRARRRLLRVGAAWVFTRSGGVWTQQGSKLVGTGAVGAAEQGHSVAISADGNTAIVGGPNDSHNSSGYGAAWVFTRSGGVWTQQGSKLVGTGAGRRPGPGRATRWRSRRTGTPPSSAGPTTTPSPVRHGCSPAAAECGRSRAASWSARAPSGSARRATRWRSRRTATPPSSVGRHDNSARRRVGVHAQRWGVVAAGQQAGRYGRRSVHACVQGSRLRSRRTATPPSSAGTGQLRRRRRVGVHAQRWGVDAAGQQAGRHRRRRGCLAGPLGGDLGGWEHRHRRRARQLRDRCRVGVHAQRWRVVAAGQQAGRHGRRRRCAQGTSVAISADGNTAIVGGPATTR